MSDNQKISLIEKAFERIKLLKLPADESRKVLVEKYYNPTLTKAEEREEIDYFLDNEIITGHSHVEIEWRNKQGNLHSFNDFPSRIVFGTYNWLELEWHKNGFPFRKNNLFNKISVVERYNFAFSENDRKELQTTIQWLNQKGELHSFYDMPAKITKDSIEWYWNGQLSRRQNHYWGELPCVINSTGSMKFCEGKNDVLTSVNFPLSSTHYGKPTSYNLKDYEKFVKWPVRQLLTL